MQLHPFVNLDASAWSSYVPLMDRQPNDSAIHAWVCLLRAQHAALSTVETALKQAGLPPLSWYDVLLELDRPDRKEMRPFEIGRQLLLPQYGLSRLLDRIENAGYITRRPCSDDARGQIATITKAGKAIRRRMWPVYREAIGRAVGAHLTENEAKKLGKLLEKLSRQPAR